MGPKVQGGYNSIYGNTQYAIKAYNNSDVMAEYNWWGQYPVAPLFTFYTDGSSSIDWDPEMSFDPGGDPPKGF